MIGEGGSGQRESAAADIPLGGGDGRRDWSSGGLEWQKRREREGENGRDGVGYRKQKAGFGDWKLQSGVRKYLGRRMWKCGLFGEGKEERRMEQI